MAHIEWYFNAKGTHIEWPGRYETHFEWKFIHSFHSLKAEKGPISFEIVFTHAVLNEPESDPLAYGTLV